MPVRAFVVLLAAALLDFAVTGAHATPPVFHGDLAVRSARGGFDKKIGIASLRVKNWDLVLSADSNGIQPDREPIIVVIGSSDQLVIPAGGVHASRKGRRFTFRAPGTVRGIRAFRLQRFERGCPGKACYHVAFSLVGIDLSELMLSLPVCNPMAVIVGDDDGFSGVEFDRPGGFGSSRVKIDGTCTPAGGWPWL